MESKADLGEHYRDHVTALRNYLVKRTGSAELAEDLTQETFVRVKQADRWRAVQDPRAYLFACAKNVLVDHFRRTHVRPNDATGDFDDETLHVAGPSEERRLEARETLRLLSGIIASLPPRTRKSFLLNRVYRLSYAEVGRMMGISPRTVENNVAKGLKVCTEKLEEVLIGTVTSTTKSNDVLNAPDIVDLSLRRIEKNKARKN